MTEPLPKQETYLPNDLRRMAKAIAAECHLDDSVLSHWVHPREDGVDLVVRSISRVDGKFRTLTFPL